MKVPFTWKVTGWFMVGWSLEFPTGETKALKYFGEDMVAYRDESGHLHVMEAHCKHLGAHLGHGGKIVGADIAHRYTSKPVYLRAVEIRTRSYGTYEVNTTFAPVDEDVSPTVYASRAAFERAGVAPADVDVIQLQDTDAGAEIIHMAEAGFCADGDQEKLLADGATEITGSMPINTDGGLIANGEPIGASGLRQIHELVKQLRGEAGDRQVPGEPRVGFAQPARRTIRLRRQWCRDRPCRPPHRRRDRFRSERRRGRRGPPRRGPCSGRTRPRVPRPMRSCALAGSASPRRLRCHAARTTRDSSGGKRSLPLHVG